MKVIACLSIVKSQFFHELLFTYQSFLSVATAVSFPCPLCGRVFKRQGWLVRHLASKHGNQTENAPFPQKELSKPSSKSNTIIVKGKMHVSVGFACEAILKKNQFTYMLSYALNERVYPVIFEFCHYGPKHIFCFTSLVVLI